MLRANRIRSAFSHPGRSLRFEFLEKRQLFCSPCGAPVITSFIASNPISDAWIFSGKVVDTSAPVAGMEVVLGGVLAPYHLTAKVGKNGTFEVGDCLPFVQPGWATAQVQDSHGHKSNVMDAYVNSPGNVPDISFDIRRERTNRLTLSGNVTDGKFVAGQKVVFGGILAAYNISTPVNADGTYQITVEVPGIKDGIATAVVVDPDGAKGNVAHSELG